MIRLLRLVRARMRETAQRGFTLVELLVACTVMGLIIVPLCGATIFFLAHGSEANTYYQDDNGARLVNTYFTGDVASATSVDVNGAGCSADVGSTLVMNLPWTQNGISMKASWFTETISGTPSLVRHRCTANTLDESNTLASLSSAGSVWFSVTGGNSTPTKVLLGFTNTNGLATTLSASPRWAFSTSNTVPSPPAGVSATVASGQATLSWLAPAETGGSAVTGYTVTASPGGATCTTTAPTQTCTITGLTNGTTYTFSVTATNSVGTGAAATTSATIGGVPGAPTNLQASIANQQTVLTWSAPASNGGFAITSYTATATPGNFTCTSSNTTCTITGLTNGTTYTVSVTATNQAGTGPASSTVTVTPGTVPTAPTNVSARVLDTQSIITWSAPADNGGYAVTSYTVTTSPSTTTCNVSVPTMTCTMTGLTNGTLYTVSVTATNARGTGPAGTTTVTPQPVPGGATNVVAGSAGTTSLLAGSGTATFADGTGSGASFNTPTGVAVDSSGNVYVADTTNNRIRKITSAGVVTTLAGQSASGNTDATGASAKFNGPKGVAVDSSGNVYVADTGNHRIRKVTSAGVVTTLAGSSSGYTDATGASAKFNSPTDVAVDSSGNVYVADTSNNRIRKVTSGGVVTTLAGSGTATFADGTGTGASFNAPSGIDIDVAGTNLYVADTSNNRIRKIVISSGVVTTPAGSGTAGTVDGSAASAQFNAPFGIAVDLNGNVFVDSQGSNKFREYTPSNGYVSTFAGSGSAAYAEGSGTAASFSAPSGIEADSSGHLYVADKSNHRIRKIVLGSGLADVTWTAPASQGGSAITSYTVTSTPDGVTCTGSSTICTVSGLTGGTAYTFIVVATNSYGPGADSTTSNSFTPLSLPGAPTGVSAVGGNTNAAVSWTAPASNGGASITSYTATATPGNFTCTATAPTTNCTINGLTNNTAYTVTVHATNSVGDGPESSSASVTPGFVPNAPTNVVAGRAGTTALLAGSTSGIVNGTGSGAKFAAPSDVAFDPEGNVYVADTSNNAIRKITPLGVVTTFASGFSSPQGIVVDSSGNVYLADTGHHQIKKVTPSGTVTTFAGAGAGYVDATGTSAKFSSPQGIAIDSAGSNLYIADTGNNRIRKITLPGAVVTTVAGQTTAGFADGTGAAAKFNAPQALTVGSSGNIYVADTTNNRIRQVTTGGVVTTFAGDGTAAYLDGTTGTSAEINAPDGIDADSTGRLYVADSGDHRIRVISTSGVVQTLAGTGSTGSTEGTASGASFSSPAGLALDAMSHLYVADSGNNRIRSISLASGTSSLTWTAPSANGGAAVTSYTVTASPGGATCTSANTYCTLTGLTDGTSYTFTVTATNATGTGSASSASNSLIPYSAPGSPTGVTATGGDTTAAISWTAPASNGGTAVTTYTAIAGFSGYCTATAPTTNCTITGLTNNTTYAVYVIASNGVAGSAFTSSVNVEPGFVPNAPTNVVAGRAGTTALLAGSTSGILNGTGSAAKFAAPNDVAFDPEGNVYVADTTNNEIRQITPTGVVTTFAGQTASGSTDATGTSAKFNGPQGIVADPSGTALYVADTGNHRIRKITLPGAVVTTLAGAGSGYVDATGTSAKFNTPKGIAIDSAGSNLYVADTSNNRIRAITLPGAVVTTVAGQTTAGFADGTGAAAKFSAPQALTVGSSGNIYVADTNNNRIRQVTTGGVVTTYAGDGTAGYLDGTTATSAEFNAPDGIDADPSGRLYVATSGGHRIRVISTNGVVSTLAGTGSAGSTEGTASGASFSSPAGLAFDTMHHLYVADSGNNRIRSISLASGDASLTWTAPAANGGDTVTSYTATASPGGATCTSANTYCTLTGLTDGTSYTFTVTATNGTGTGSASSASNSLIPYSPPGAPTGVTAQGDVTSAAISWTAPASNGGTSITTYTATASFGAYCTATSPATSCTITGLTSNTTYSIQVVASNNIAGSALSSAVNVTTTYTPIAFGAIGTATTWTSNYTAKSVAYPTGTSSGDLLILAIEGNQEPGKPTSPSGWNAGDFGAGPSGGPHVAVYWKLAGSETSVSVTPYNGGSSAAWVVRYVQGSTTPVVATSATCGASGTTVPGACGYGATAVSSATPATTATNTAQAIEIQLVMVPANHTLSLSTAQGFTFEGTSGTSASGDAIGIADQQVASSGTTPTAPTWSLGGTSKYAYLSIAFH